MRIGLLAAACVWLQGQDTPASDSPMELKGLPPRAAPADYQAQGKAGALTVAAEFKGHSVPTMQGPLNTDEYVVVEVGLYGAPDARLRISSEEFSLAINGRKAPLPAQRYGMVLASLKDPEWEPPEKAAARSKTRLGGGGGDEQREPGAAPPVVKIPVQVQRAMAQRVQQAALLEGDRALPQAGLLFFQYRGKAQSIRSVELIYDGPAGRATLALQP